MALSRRTFLLRSTEAVLAGGTAAALGHRFLASPASRWREEAFAPVGRSRVAVLRASDYDADLAGPLRQAIADTGLDLQGARVLLKPNLVEYDPGTSINTDPRLVAAVAEAVRSLGATSVSVGEGPGHRRDTAYVVRASGLAEALADVGVDFVDLNTDAVRQVRLDTSYTSLGSLWLPVSVVDADVVVSIPKLKTHHWAGATLSLKNCFGCVPGRIYGWPKNVLHFQGLERSILDVAAAVRPSLAIIDGIVGMEGDGPIRGTPVDAGVLVVSSDPVAADAAAARLMGLDPERIGYLAEAGRFLGQHHLEELELIGEDLERSSGSFEVLPVFEHLKVGSTQRANATIQSGSA